MRHSYHVNRISNKKGSVFRNLQPKNYNYAMSKLDADLQVNKKKGDVEVREQDGGG